MGSRSDRAQRRQQERAAQAAAQAAAQEEERKRLEHEDFCNKAAAQIFISFFSMVSTLLHFNTDHAATFFMQLIAVLGNSFAIFSTQAAHAQKFVEGIPTAAIHAFQNRLIGMIGHIDGLNEDCLPQNPWLRTHVFPLILEAVTELARINRPALKFFLDNCCIDLPEQANQNHQHVNAARIHATLTHGQRRRFKNPKSWRIPRSQMPRQNAAVARCTKDWNSARGSSSTKGTKRNGSILPSSLSNRSAKRARYL